jgi:4-hydroxy-3-methylbut-2-enyl diphosphate reductase
MDKIQAEAMGSARPTYLLGKLVHNRHAVARLEELGAKVVSSLDEVPAGAAAVVSTHGMGPEIADAAQARGVTLVDATCPFVSRIHRVVGEMVAAGFAVFVFGDAGHKEVQGILAWANGRAIAVDSSKEVVTTAARIGIVSQTTRNLDAYRRLVQEVAGSYLGGIAELRVADTICDATAQRQAAAISLAAQVDAVVVVGGADSANTRRLGELAAAAGTPTYVVEQASDLDSAWFIGKQRVGVTAGASTPNWIIDEVVETLRSL